MKACPACRQYTADVARVLKEDRRIRVIYRDAPLLGPRSDEAARAAIASSFQGRHEPFHHALMTTKGFLDVSAIKAAARRAGVNWSRLERDMVSRREDIDLLIARNFQLATEIGIAGTPAFIVGERQSNGALDYQSLKLEIADARKEVGASKAADPIEEANPKLVRPTNPKLGSTQGAEAALKGNNGPTVAFETRIERPRISPSEGSGGNKAWKWLLAAVMVGVGVAALWVFASVQRKARSNDTTR